LNWHLDCLDPPLANPPPSGKGRAPWRCPNHADHELEGSVPQAPGRRKIRRPKQPEIVDVNLRRGFKNDGRIEVLLDRTFEEDLVQPNARVVYRLQERGIKLDFIDRVKRAREDSVTVHDRFGSEGPLSSRGLDSATLPMAAELSNRSIDERNAALSLAEFLQTQPDIEFMPEAVDDLLRALIMEAPPEIASLISSSSVLKMPGAIPPSPPPSDSRTDRDGIIGSGHGRGIDLAALANSKDALAALQELIQRRLESLEDDE